MLQVGQKAPDFTAPAVLDSNEIDTQFHLHTALLGKMGLLFFYPLDFTFVCPTELIALDRRQQAFKALGVETIAISVDSPFTHLAWRNTPVEQGGIGNLRFPLVSDLSHAITKAYGVENPKESVAYRASFLIDQSGYVRHASVNDLPIGRNIDELIRLVQAIQFHQQHGEVCPAQWENDKPAMVASAEGVKQYLADHASGL